VRPEEGTLLFQHYLHITNTNNNKRHFLFLEQLDILPFLIANKKRIIKPGILTPHSLNFNKLQISQSLKDMLCKLSSTN